jgi:phosphoribosylformylglycinamidine cyclo-ligase
MSENETYKASGVNLEAAGKTKKTIAMLAKKTFNANVLHDVGLFGGFFQLDTNKYKNPVLVSSVDGVGTKLKIAFQMRKHDTVGEDLVNHCVNDIMTGGAEPLFFLDYISITDLDPGVVTELIGGLVRGCTNANCVLIGGETAEMPGFYPSGEYDIAGTIVGVVEKDKIVDGRRIQKGDILLGVPSSGLHTNGYSLARKVLFGKAGFKPDKHFDELGMTLGEALLQVHLSYQKIILALRNEPYLKGMSHITGGGIVDNTKRILPKGLDLHIYWENWEILPIYKLIQKFGNVEVEEMRQVFNLGIGFIFVIDRQAVEKALSKINEFVDFVYIVGEVI